MGTVSHFLRTVVDSVLIQLNGRVAHCNRARIQTAGLDNSEQSYGNLDDEHDSSMNSPPSIPIPIPEEDDLELLYQAPIAEPQDRNERLASTVNLEVKVEELKPEPVGQAPVPLTTTPGPSLPGRIIELFTRLGSVGAPDRMDLQRASLPPPSQHSSSSNNGEFMINTLVRSASCPSDENAVAQSSKPNFPAVDPASSSMEDDESPTKNMKRASFWPDPRSKRQKLCP